MAYEAGRDCYVQKQVDPIVTRRVYGTYEGKLRIEEMRDYFQRSGHISEHSACIASLSAAGPLLTDEEPTEAMRKYHTLEGCSGL